MESLVGCAAALPHHLSHPCTELQEGEEKRKKKTNTLKRLGKFYSLLNCNSFSFVFNTINTSVIAFKRRIQTHFST